MNPRILARPLAALCLSLSVPAAAEVVVTESRRHYVLDASTQQGLVEQLATRRAIAVHSDVSRSHGLTEARMETRYELAPRADGRCALRRIVVAVHLTQTLPEWTPAQPPAPGLTERVARMLEGLASHESGHRRHVLATAASIDRKLAALGVAESCERASRAAERVVSRELIRLQANERAYDLATGRGRKQGAVLEREPPAQRRRSRFATQR